MTRIRLPGIASVIYIIPFESRFKPMGLPNDAFSSSPSTENALPLPAMIVSTPFVAIDFILLSPEDEI